NKNVTEEQLMLTAERVFGRGWSRMKLYFMIGLPTEEEEDVREIVRTGSRAQKLGRRLQKGRGPQVTVSVSIHVPKPHTPFQWCAMDPRATVLEKQSWLTQEAKANKIKLRMHDSDGSWIEGVIARGDRTLADVIERAWRNGARFDSWDEHLNIDAWTEAFDAHDVTPGRFLGTLPISARLPWDHIDVGLEEGFLAREYRKALASRLSPPCGKAAGMFVHHTNLTEANDDARRLVCYDCGVACDMSQMRSERLDYLSQLGAENPPPPRPDTPSLPVVQKHRKPPQTRKQGDPIRVRIRYAKLGRAAYRGHLDLVRVLPRIFRRANMPLYYSRGFHPKPEMVFGPALSLGIASLDEYVDVKLDGDVPFELEGLAERLSEVTELGLEIRDVRRLENGDKRITRIMDEAVYVAGLSHMVLTERGLGDLETLRARVAERRDGDLTVLRKVKGIGKKIDVGRYLLDVDVGEGGEVLEEAGIGGSLVPVRLRLRVTGGGTCKPSEAIRVLLGAGDEDVPVRLVRQALLAYVDDAPVHPMDLETLRKPHLRKIAEARAEAQAGAAAS
ncbi:MAG: TIGR03936 family radical SAM-associated protein, partial [Sandaracinaceae bacterium]